MMVPIPFESRTVNSDALKTMQYRHLGANRLKLSAISYGCPPFVGQLNEADEKTAIAVIH